MFSVYWNNIVVDMYFCCGIFFFNSNIVKMFSICWNNIAVNVRLRCVFFLNFCGTDMIIRAVGSHLVASFLLYERRNSDVLCYHSFAKLQILGFI